MSPIIRQMSFKRSWSVRAQTGVEPESAAIAITTKDLPLVV
jgi:hypothetical protein